MDGLRERGLREHDDTLIVLVLARTPDAAVHDRPAACGRPIRGI